MNDQQSFMEEVRTYFCSSCGFCDIDTAHNLSCNGWVFEWGKKPRCVHCVTKSAKFDATGYEFYEIGKQSKRIEAITRRASR